MRRSSVGIFVIVLIVIVVAVLSLGDAKSSYEFSQSYTCDGIAQGQRVTVVNMQWPVIGFIRTQLDERLGRSGNWYTFERGEVLLDFDVRYYFSLDRPGGSWQFSYLPEWGDIVMVPLEEWSVTTVGDDGTTIRDLFESVRDSPNCWSEETLARTQKGQNSSALGGGGYTPLPPGTVGDF